MTRFWYVVLVVVVVAGLAAMVVGPVWYVRSEVQHECQALTFIEHSGIKNKQFLASVQYWAVSDGC